MSQEFSFTSLKDIKRVGVILFNATNQVTDYNIFSTNGYTDIGQTMLLDFLRDKREFKSEYEILGDISQQIIRYLSIILNGHIDSINYNDDFSWRIQNITPDFYDSTIILSPDHRFIERIKLIPNFEKNPNPYISGFVVYKLIDHEGYGESATLYPIKIRFFDHHYNCCEAQSITMDYLQYIGD